MLTDESQRSSSNSLASVRRLETNNQTFTGVTSGYKKNARLGSPKRALIKPDLRSAN